MHINSNDILHSAGRYVRRFRNKVFVIKLGGDVLADAAALRGVCEQLFLLWSFSISIVVVHGAGPQLDLLCQKLGVEVSKHNGRRITDAGVLKAAQYEFGAEQLRLVAELRAAGMSAVGLSGVDAHLVTARRRPATDEVNWGFVGDIEQVDPSLLLQLIAARHVPVIAPLTGDDTGQIFNTNADTLAAAVAAAVQAEKLLFAMKAPGLLSEPDNAASLIPAADLAGLEQLQQQGKLAGGMLAKADAVRRALRDGVPAVHLVSGFAPDALLTEVFTNEGSGSMLTAEPPTSGETAG